MQNIKKILHHNVFTGETDYIPLIIKVPVVASEIVRCTRWEALNNPDKVLRTRLNECEQLCEIESDFVPFIESDFVECLIPSLFGATAYEAPGNIVSVKPIFSDPEDLEKIKIPNLMGGMMPQAIEHLTYIKENAPEWLVPQISRMLSPLDAAVVMRGGDFYLDMAMEPEIVVHFLNVLTETVIGVVKILKGVIGEPITEQVTVRGLYFPGIRLTNDSIVNVSPAMIQDLYFPCLRRFKEAFGHVMLHYCCTPAPSGHVLPTLLKCNYVDAVDNWQGYETFFNNEEDMLQDKIAICTDLPFDTLMNFEDFANKIPFFSQVKRKGGRGLTITTTAPSVEEARRLWMKWQNMQKR